MPDCTGATILIIDDTPENISLLSRILQMNGYRIEAARDGFEGVQLAKNNLPDLILMDVDMPGMDGFETCARLKEDELTRQIPVIFISAIDNVEDKTHAFHTGGVDYIIKPFDYEEVQARVETHLVIQRLRIKLEQANQALAARVSELTTSKEQLAERERRLSAFVSALPNLSFVMDDRGRYLEVIANEPQLLYASSDALVGRLVEDVLPPKEAAKIMDSIQQAIETGKIQSIEYQITVQSGGERWFEGRIAVMEKGDPGPSKVVLMATDTTERVQLYQEVQRLANQDVLTGCFNRRHFMEKAGEEIQRDMRYNSPLSLLMVDIDHFKNLNDHYGHQIGDQMLCNLVLLCKKQLRSIDVIGRYGGDEFVILMPETEQAGGKLAAERLREKIEKMKIKTGEGELSITVSMGLASLARGFDGTNTVDTLVRRADKALYNAKAAGRNCIQAL